MLRVINDHILLRKKENEQKTSSGIILNEFMRKSSMQGEVIAIGEGRLVDGNRVKLLVNKGDVVIYKEFAGVPVFFDYEEFVLISEEDVLAIIG